MNISIPDWATHLTMEQVDGVWHVAATGDLFRTGNPRTGIGKGANLQHAINYASNMVTCAQERAVAPEPEPVVTEDEEREDPTTILRALISDLEEAIEIVRQMDADLMTMMRRIVPAEETTT